MAVLEESIKEVRVLPNYINGEWVESESDRILDVVNPATCKVIAKVPISTHEELDKAVQAAQAAFPRWRETSPVSRARCMFRLKELMEEHFEELSRIGVMEHGKTIDEFRGEVRRSIENVEVATGIPSLMMGYNLEDIASGIDEYVIRQPYGVFACISPFNFPLMVSLWFMPYAVATGNTYIIKPSSEVPLSQTKLCELIEEAGFPPGVINIVQGGRDVVGAILDHPSIKGVSFVGSTPVGRDVVYKRAAATGKKVQAQCGAKNWLVIMPDTTLDRTVASIMTSVYGCTGQRCLSGSNVAVIGDNAFYERFKRKVVEMALKIRVGYGLDESVQMGPVRSADKKERIVSYIEKGLGEGAKLILDGRKPKIVGNYPDTCFLGPNIFENVAPDMTIAKEEIFGPVMTILRVKNLDEAIDQIHANPFGNAASIFTSSGKWSREFQYKVQCGNIGINVGIVAPMAFFPFSGMKDSFFGDKHGQGRDAIEFFTERKVVIVRWF